MSNFKEGSIWELALCILNDTVHPLLQITSAVFREFSFNLICTNLVGNFNLAPILKYEIKLEPELQKLLSIALRMPKDKLKSLIELLEGLF